MGAPLATGGVPGQPVSKGLEVGQLAALQNLSFLPSCGFVSCEGMHVCLSALVRWACVLTLLQRPQQPCPIPTPAQHHADSRAGGPHRV